MAQSFVWPLYFATKSLKSARVNIRKGQVFPIQDKHYLRGLGRAYGVENADKLTIPELPYVAVLNVGGEAEARQILDRKLTLDEAKTVLQAGG